jgi:hypothetical protein
VSAIEDKNRYEYQVDKTKYTVEFMDGALSAEMQERVANRMIYGNDPEMQKYGLSCILFGHDLKASKVSVVTHKVYKYAPRCKQEIYDVTICEKCDYQTQTLYGTTYIDCCPED